jgi:calcineurin-like phosphoesterase family protein
MMTDFYISDTHFDHINIIRLCNRPFQSVDEMNAEMVRRWNEVVSDNDTVYHLGDFAWRDKTADYWQQQLRGQIIFLRGNHAAGPEKTSQLYYLERTDGPYNLVLCHYPIVSWNGMYRGSFHFYGHVHGSPHAYMPLDWRARAFDVGVECLNYTPRTADDIIMKGNC